MDVWVFILIGLIVVFTIASYFLLMVFFPEWVGITGKKALEAERSHQSGEAGVESGVLENMQKPAPKKTQ